MDLDPDGAVPLYRQVADILIRRIEAGELQPNRPVPSVARLVQEFGIARGTAVKALQTLRELGYVETVPGKGTYVTERLKTD